MDPDFGWHLRNGELIQTIGFFKTDPFSYTMPSFPVVSHAWGSGVLFSIINSTLGYWALSVIFSLLAIGTIAFSLPKEFWQKSKDKTFVIWKSMIWIVSFAAIFPIGGVRPQVISWFLLAILLKILRSEKTVDFKNKIALIPFFILWANLHGSFIAGFIVYAIVIFGKSIREKSLLWRDILVFISCVFATLLNPYGISLWREVWETVTSTTLRFAIMEWMPTFFVANTAYFFIVCLSVALFIRFWKKFLLEERLLFLFFLIQSLSGARHIPLFVIISTKVLILCYLFLKKEIDRLPKISKDRFEKFVLILFSVGCIVSLMNLYSSFKSSMVISEKNFFPKEAISFIKQNQLEGEIFSEYGWGGYLIWKMPERKVFIDGRMAIWKWDGNPESESSEIMKEYLDILKSEKDYKPVFEKYDITYVLWPNISEKKKNEFWETIENYIAKIVGYDRPKEGIIKRIKNDGWKEIYSDPISIIFQKP